MLDDVQPAGAGQGAQPAAPVVPAPVVEPVKNDSPWASDLALLGLDDATLGKVDMFMRAKVQPYTTQLEQAVAGAKPATLLFNDLSDPAKSVDAFVAVTYEMFGQDAGDNVLAALQGQTAEQQQATVAAALEAPAPTAPQYAQLDPETQAFLDEQRQESAVRTYDQDMATTIAANPDINPNHLHIWVAQADGNFDQAVALYRQYIADFIKAPEGDKPAPPVLGSDTGGAAASSMPVAPKKQTMAQALDNTMNMLKKQEAPAVVG